jgi:hypothetical protein
VIAEDPATTTAYQVGAVGSPAAHGGSCASHDTDIGARGCGEERRDIVRLHADLRTGEPAGQQLRDLNAPGFACRARYAGGHPPGVRAVRQSLVVTRADRLGVGHERVSRAAGPLVDGGSA